MALWIRALCAFIVFSVAVTGQAHAQQAPDEAHESTDDIGRSYDHVRPLPGDEDVPNAPPPVFDESSAIEPRIVGGTTASIRSHPWAVQVYRMTAAGNPVTICGGVILRAGWIVTAAHCVDDQVSYDHVQITAGSTNESLASGQQRVASQVTIHGSWLPLARGGLGSGFDIALLRLERALDFNQNVKAIPIANPAELAAAGEAQAVGWGADERDGDLPGRLRQVTVSLISDSTCAAVLMDLGVVPPGVTTPPIADRELCAGNPGRDVCDGDSGGPLTITTGSGQRKLVGLASFSACGAAPGVFVEVDHFINWLNQRIPKRKCLGQTVTVDMALGQVPTTGRDVIAGTRGPDLIRALTGNDLICAMNGGDTIFGGGGADIIYAGNGADTAQGGSGGDRIFGGNGTDELRGNGGRDHIDGGGNNDDLFGGGGGDTLEGDNGNDDLRGGGGDDILRGQAGNDECRGEGGADILAASCETRIQ